MSQGQGGGRPTKYQDTYPDLLITYFNIPSYTELECEYQTKDGKTETKTVIKAADLPLIINFCEKIGIVPATFHDWVHRYPKFSNAYKRCKEHQARILIENGLQGHYDSRFASLAAKNMIGWRDKTEQETTITHKLPAKITVELVRAGVK